MKSNNEVYISRNVLISPLWTTISHINYRD